MREEFKTMKLNQERHYPIRFQYFILTKYKHVQTACILNEHSPLGELGPGGAVCPLGADISTNILEFSLPGEH